MTQGFSFGGWSRRWTEKGKGVAGNHSRRRDFEIWFCNERAGCWLSSLSSRSGMKEQKEVESSLELEQTQIR